MVTAFGLVIVALGLAVPVGLFVVLLVDVLTRRRLRRSPSKAMLLEFRRDMNVYLNQDHSKLEQQYREGRMSEMRGFDWESDQ